MNDTPETPPETGPETGPDSSETSGAQDVPPDRLSVEPGSEYFQMEKLQRGVAISFKGARRTNVEEYCISEGWVRVQAGKTVDRNGKPLTLRLKGPVEAWYEDLGEDAPHAKAD